MPPSSHPDMTRLGDYIIGDLSPGATLAVAAHISLCPTCAAAVRLVEASVEWRDAAFADAGAVARQASFDDVLRGALAAALAAREPDVRSPAGCDDGVCADDVLRRADGGFWISAGPGLRMTRLKGVSGLGEAVWVVRAEPGAALPLEEGQAIDCALVLEGALDLASGPSLPPGSLLETPRGRFTAAPGQACALLLLASSDRRPLLGNPPRRGPRRPGGT